MRRPTLVAVLLVAACLVAACSAGPLLVAPSSTTARLGTPPQFKTDGWPMCTSLERGYMVRHPPGWYSARPAFPPDLACRYFDPGIVEWVPGIDAVSAAVTLTTFPRSADDVVKDLEGRADVLSRSESRNGGQRRLAIEYRRRTAVGNLPARSFGYDVVVELGPGTVVLTTSALETGTLFNGNKAVVDAMASTVTAAG